MELLVWLNDKKLDDADIGTDLDFSSYKQGDVICVMPDGWGWTDSERNNPDWVIIRSPIVQSLADALTTPVETQTNEITPCRNNALDVVALGLVAATGKVTLGKAINGVSKTGRSIATSVILEVVDIDIEAAVIKK
jgi:hypothetical protein